MTTKAPDIVVYIKYDIKYDIRYCIRYCAFLIVMGSGIEHFIHKQSYGAVFDNYIQIQAIIGSILLIIGALMFGRYFSADKGRLRYIFFAPALLLALNSYCSFIEAGYVPEQLVEHAIKIGIPFLAALNLVWSVRNGKLIWILKVLVASTFIGHALFALGFHYVPDGFIKMTKSILFLSNSSSRLFLAIIGVLDILFAILLFANARLSAAALYYLISWGLITAIARFIYPFYLAAPSLQIVGSGFLGMVYRLPHGLIPLLIFIYQYHIFVRVQNYKNRIQKQESPPELAVV